MDGRGSCGHINAPGAKFCSECGTPVLTIVSHEERKVLSVLFCDLVDYTASSDRADPEDVSASLRRYHAEARRIVGSLGGVVEKFIGDAVCAVFGVPAVHEDDPERAVRAAVEICEAMPAVPPIAGQALQVRCGITTGEVLVHLDVDPTSGEGLITGDTVNVAARLQSVAPAGRVVVDRRTFDLLSRRFPFEALDAVTLKGKPEPVPLFLVGHDRGRPAPTEPVAPFTGRVAELAELSRAFEAVRHGASMQLATVLGDAGIGKTRLVTEFTAPLMDRGARVRTGRCLPYGDGMGFWALGEIVKAHAGAGPLPRRDERRPHARRDVRPGALRPNGGSGHRPAVRGAAASRGLTRRDLVVSGKRSGREVAGTRAFGHTHVAVTRTARCGSFSQA